MCNNNIILSTLSVPLKEQYTNYQKIGDELYEPEKQTEVETCTRMMNILKLSLVPKRSSLVHYIKNNNLLLNCNIFIKNLFELEEFEENPIILAKKSYSLLKELQENLDFNKYYKIISRNIVIKSLRNMSKIYDSISLDRLSKLFDWFNLDEIEEIIYESTRIGVLNCEIDHISRIVSLKNKDFSKYNLKEGLKTFVNGIEEVAGSIIKLELSNSKGKLEILKTSVSQQIQKHYENSLTNYDNFLTQMKQRKELLDKFNKFHNERKEKKREESLKEMEIKAEKVKIEARNKRLLYKNKEKQKETEIQYKKFLINKIRIFTNVVMIDGKKAKLEDISKDLSKVSDIQLEQLVETEQNNFKTKKQKKFNEYAKTADYTTREFRRRDNESFIEKTKAEEDEYNRKAEEENKKLYNERIGVKNIFKATNKFKECYFDQLLNKRKEDYNKKFNDFKKELDKTVLKDFFDDINNHFKVYIEDFNKREKLAKEKQATYYRPPKNNTDWKKGDNATKFEKEPVQPMSFSSKYIIIKNF